MAITSLSACLAEELKCYFSYTIEEQERVVGGGFFINENSAFLVFDTTEQKIKVVNFLHAKPFGILNHSNIFASYRTLNVSRRHGDSPVTTLEELFDFSTAEWAGREEIESGSDTPYYREFTVDIEGIWNKVQYDDESTWSANGSITGYTLFSPSEHESLYFDRDRIPGYLFLSTGSQLGFRYSLFASNNLTEWDPVGPISTDPFSGRSYVDLTGTLIGRETSLIDLFLIDLNKIEIDRFFRIEISPLNYGHL